MYNGIYQLVRPANEYCMNYAEGCPEREALLAEVERQANMTVEIPMVIDGKEIFPEKTVKVVEPHRHANVIANLHIGGEAELREAIEASLRAAKQWAATPWEDRVAVFLKAVEMLGGYPKLRESFTFEDLTVTILKRNNLRVLRLLVEQDPAWVDEDEPEDELIDE